MTTQALDTAVPSAHDRETALVAWESAVTPRHRVVTLPAGAGEAGLDVIERCAHGALHVLRVAGFTRHRHASERSIGAILMALIAGDHCVAAEEREPGLGMRLRAKTVFEARSLVAALAHLTKPTGVRIFVAGGTTRVDVQAAQVNMAGAAGDLRVPAAQWQPGRVVIERDLFPVGSGMAGATIGRRICADDSPKNDEEREGSRHPRPPVLMV